ncbi:MAG: ferrous iron transport protein B [Tannerella sp.]|jgi:ferrous iron transport protein B|nr:ferrous iron transport protein B [Tannerella sp.]
MENQNNEIQYLADLPIGKTAIITKIKGYGAFRKRITEMGFVYGTPVRTIKKAPFPFQDPVEYEVMGYRVSLRKNEAQMIEIAGDNDIKHSENQNINSIIISDEIRKIAKEKGKRIQVALVGNPNAGKTSLFNFATGKQERVGNYGGVTVDLKTARLKHNGYRIDMTDLPGTYSISEYSPEELFVRKHLTEAMPDVVINVIDASNLERNLYLTTQLIDMNIKVVIALNMFDELEDKGDKLDYVQLGKLLGFPIVPTVASKGKGINELIEKVIDVYEEKEKDYHHIHINYGKDINRSVEKLKKEIKKNTILTDKYHAQYVAVKLLENDKNFTKQIDEIPQTALLLKMVAEETSSLEQKYNGKIETIIADAKYSFIRGALKETYYPSKRKKIKGYELDNIMTDKWLGIPVFLFLMWLMFQMTFTLGNYPMDWIDASVGALNSWVQNVMSDGILRDMITEGIIAGVGSVIIFLPNIIILFLCISLMEDTGYMARAAFIMDRLMHKIGLHGKSFIPLLMGFGCNVPAIMATRTLENRKDRLVTMLILPFMSCSARLPVYILLISAFFVKYKALTMFSIYLAGIFISAAMAIVFNSIVFKKRDIPFVMELPPYRIPTLRNTFSHTWNKSVQYLQKMGTIILAASIIIWSLGYFPHNEEHKANSPEAAMESSYIGRLGHMIEPVIQPLGFDWKIGVSLITGMMAKEIVVSSMGVLYQNDSEADENSETLKTKIREQTFTSGKKAGRKVFTPLVAYSFMIFILLYFPCIAAIVAIKREAGWRWALFTVCYTTVIAWLVSFGIYQIGILL